MLAERLRLVIDEFTMQEIGLQNTKEDITKKIIALLNNEITYDDAYNYSEIIVKLRDEINDRNSFILNELEQRTPKNNIINHLVAKGFTNAGAKNLIEYVEKSMNLNNTNSNQIEKLKEEIATNFFNEFPNNKEKISIIDFKSFIAKEFYNISFDKNENMYEQDMTTKLFSKYELAIIISHLFSTQNISTYIFEQYIEIEDLYLNESESVDEPTVNYTLDIAGQVSYKYHLLEDDIELNKINDILFDYIMNENNFVYIIMKEIKKTEELKEQQFIQKTLTLKNNLFKNYAINIHDTNSWSVPKKIFSAKDIFLILIYAKQYDTYDNVLLFATKLFKTKLTELNETMQIKMISKLYHNNFDPDIINDINLILLNSLNYFTNICLINISSENINNSFDQIKDNTISSPKWRDIFTTNSMTRGIRSIFFKAIVDFANLKTKYNIDFNDINKIPLNEKIFNMNYHDKSIKFDDEINTLGYLVHFYDVFNTKFKLSSITNEIYFGQEIHEFQSKKFFDFYNTTSDEIEIETMNRFIIFWIGIAEKIITK